MEEPIPRFSILVKRGWRKKCPHCGQGDLYQGWMRLRDRCVVCGLKYLQNQGDILGPLMFVDRLLFMVPTIVLFYFGLWRPSVVGFVLFGVTTLALLIYTMPNRNGLNVAMDYLISRKDGEVVRERQ